MQPQSCSSRLARGRVFQLTKRFENQSKRFLRNADPRIYHAKLYTASVIARCHRDTPLSGELYRIPKQILEHDF